MKSCMKATSPGGACGLERKCHCQHVLLGAALGGSTPRGTVVWSRVLFFFFFKWRTETPHACLLLTRLPEQPGVLTAPLSTLLYLCFLKRCRAKRGLRTAPGPCRPCMQCLALMRGTVSLWPVGWPAFDCHAWPGPLEKAEDLPQDLE